MSTSLAVSVSVGALSFSFSLQRPMRMSTPSFAAEAEAVMPALYAFPVPS